MRNGEYELVKAPEGYPGKRYRGRYAYEHHVVWWQETGQALDGGFVIHHKNGQKRDNRIENLERLSASVHSSHHGAEKGRQMVVLACPQCLREFEREKRQTHLCTSRKSKATYCSRSCAGKMAKLGYKKVDQVIREYTLYSDPK